MDMPDETDVDSIEIEWDGEFVARRSLAIEDLRRRTRVSAAKKTVRGWEHISTTPTDNVEVTARVDGEEIDVVGAILARASANRVLGLPRKTVDPDRADGFVTRMERGWGDMYPNKQPDDTPADGVHPAESDADNPIVGEHSLRPVEGDHPASGSVWECEHCGRKGTDTGVFNNFGCEE